MTSKDRLIELVAGLPDEEAEELLKLATELYVLPVQRRPIPEFVGIGDSGRTDVSQKVDDLLRDGFGRS
ncbi:MAG: hypothetical protein ACRDXB_18255 [Actinomycetes bacterium]